MRRFSDFALLEQPSWELLEQETQPAAQPTTSQVNIVLQVSPATCLVCKTYAVCQLGEQLLTAVCTAMHCCQSDRLCLKLSIFLLE